MYEIYLKLKEEHDDKIIIINNGEFYYVYDKDSYIINYYFNYKIINKNSIEYVCFPKQSLYKILNLLNSKCIGYIIFSGIIKDISFGDSNIYQNTLLKCYDNKFKKDLIDKINEILNTFSIEKLEKIYDGIN